MSRLMHVVPINDIKETESNKKSVYLMHKKLLFKLFLLADEIACPCLKQNAFIIYRHITRMSLLFAHLN